jgi:diacylglycerol kinase (ATP)
VIDAVEQGTDPRSGGALDSSASADSDASAAAADADGNGRSSRRVRILLNPTSGAKAGLSTNPVTEEDVRRVAAAHGLGDEVVVTESEEHGIEQTREAVAAGYDVVVAAGGDGTVASVAKVLLGGPVALGILPLGSFMNVARSLGIPRDLDEAAATIATGTVAAIDVGEANDEIFLEAGAVGLNAAMFTTADEIDAGNYRALADAVRLLLRFPPSAMRLHLDDRVIATRALSVVVSNGPYMGLGFTVAPRAEVDDGELDIVVYSRLSRADLVRHFAGIAFGRQRYSPKVTHYRSSAVRVESRHPLPCTADTRDIGTTPVTFRALPGALRVIVPAAPA